MYVLDTNTRIYFFNGKGKVSSHMLDKPPKSIGNSAVVLFEIEVGIAKSTSPEKRRMQLKSLASVVNIVPFGYEQARCAAAIRVDLEKRRRPIGPIDILIAATALSQKGVLVTHNTDEFRGVEALQIEDLY
jgi:tRNA(fMet)-specific endonuclease VapC